MRRRARAGIVTLALALTALSSCGASGTSTVERAKSGGRGVALKRIGNFAEPVYVTGAPDLSKLLFVVEREGRIQVLRNGRRLGRPFLDISGRVSVEGERGLLSAAFPPDYRESGRFYVYYTDNSGNIRIDEFHRRSQTRAAFGSRRPVIEIPHEENSNHNGGQAQFLGNFLYFGTGDGGSAGDPPNNAQNKNSLLGKLLRIDPRPSNGRPYTVPADNPFVSKPGRDEIYSYGLRNPYRFSFDTTTAAQPRIAIADVGQNRYEELDYTTAARQTQGARLSRSSPTATAATGGAARSSGGTWSAAVSRWRCGGTISTPTTAQACCTASSLTCGVPTTTGGSGSASTPPPLSARTVVDGSTLHRRADWCTGSSPDRPTTTGEFSLPVASLANA
jgi:Glucose / Sorbosone dehydrogenase